MPDAMPSPDAAAPTANAAYRPRRAATSRFVTLRGLRHHLLEWGDASLASTDRPTLLMLHGWMDVAASFQFVVDALPDDRHVIAMDWRGFGLSAPTHQDNYWFADYLGDLDALFDLELTGRPVDLLGHSMGGNVVMLYAGLRPERIRRLVNLEGFGMPATRPEMAPKRLLTWLDELKAPALLRPYEGLAGVAERLRQTNPLLPPDKALWLAGHWSREGADGRREILADPAHKRSSPLLYQVDEVLACWARITAPLLWVQGDRTDTARWWGDRYPRSEFETRLARVPQVARCTLSPAGHMLHHDQPDALAARLLQFLG
jgi:pimeloyl-ACP methyl ester carboxylesterase